MGLNELNIENKNILVIGCPGSGKTTIAKTLNAYNHEVIHTDDYIKYGYENALYKLLADVTSKTKNTIIEGVLGYRLLRKGVELNSYYPDVVLEIETTEAQFNKVYEVRGVEKIKGVKTMIKSNESVLNDYKKLFNPNPPTWIKYQNEFF